MPRSTEDGAPAERKNAFYLAAERRYLCRKMMVTLIKPRSGDIYIFNQFRCYAPLGIGEYQYLQRCRNYVAFKITNFFSAGSSERDPAL